jgi:hypothetical protein
MKKPSIKPIDRVAIPGGAVCPRCNSTMQRFCRPDGYTPNAAPFACVRLWDRCLSCSWIGRLEQVE